MSGALAQLNLFLRRSNAARRSRRPRRRFRRRSPLSALCRELRALVDGLAACRLNVIADLGLLAAQFDPEPAFPATDAIETVAGYIVEEAARVAQSLRLWPLRAQDRRAPAARFSR